MLCEPKTQSAANIEVAELYKQRINGDNQVSRNYKVQNYARSLSYMHIIIVYIFFNLDS